MKELDRYGRVILHPNTGPNREARRHPNKGISKHRQRVTFKDQEGNVRHIEILATKASKLYVPNRKPRKGHKGYHGALNA